MKKFFILILLLLSVAFALLAYSTYSLYVNQKSITQGVIKDINKLLPGYLSVEDSQVSPFSAFPYIPVHLKKVVFQEDSLGENNTILEVENVWVGFHFIDILFANYNVKSIRAENGTIFLSQDEDGEINIYRALQIDTSKINSEHQPIKLEIDELLAENFRILKKAENSSMTFDMWVENSNLKMHHASSIIDLTLDVKGELNISEPNRTYFKDKHFDFKSQISYDKESQMMHIHPSDFSLEKAKIKLDGFADIKNDINLDVTVRGDKSNFDIFIALLPPPIIEHLNSFSNGGKIFFEGKVSGPVLQLNAPQLNFSFGCKDTYIRNNENKSRIDQIAFSGTFTNGENQALSSTVLQVEGINARVGNGKFKGDFLIENFAQPKITALINADVDLAYLSDFVGYKGVFQNLEGQLTLNLNYNDRVNSKFTSQPEREDLGTIDSKLQLKNVSFSSQQMPKPIEQLQLKSNLIDNTINIESLSLKSGNSSLKLSGKVNEANALLLSPDKEMEVNFNVAAETINWTDLLVNDSLFSAEWSSMENINFELKLITKAKELLHFDFLPSGNYTFNRLGAQFKSNTLNLSNATASMKLDSNAISQFTFDGLLNNSGLYASGSVNNYPLWFDLSAEDSTLASIDVISKNLEMKEILPKNIFAQLPEEYQHESLQNLKLKASLRKINLNQAAYYHLMIDELTARTKVHQLQASNINGSLTYGPKSLYVNNINGKIGQSDFSLNAEWFHEAYRQLGYTNQINIKSKYFNLNEFSRYNPMASDDNINHAEAWNVFKLPFSNTHIEAQFDEIKYFSLPLSQLEIKGKLTDQQSFFMDTLHAYTSGGQIAITGVFDGSNPDDITFKNTIKTKDVAVEKLMIKFDNFGKEYRLSDNLEGALTGTIHSTLKLYPDMVTKVQESEALMNVQLTNGYIIEFGPLAVLYEYLKDKTLSRIKFDTLSNELELKNGIIYIPTMKINSTIGFIEIAGQQSMDETYDMNYIISFPVNLINQTTVINFFKHVKSELKSEITGQKDEDVKYKEDPKNYKFINFRIKGTLGKYKVTYVKKANHLNN